MLLAGSSARVREHAARLSASWGQASGYLLHARPTLVAQTARFKRFNVRNTIPRRKAGRRGRGARIFHSGILHGMLFGGDFQDISARRLRAMRTAAVRAHGLPTKGVDPNAVWMLQKAEYDPRYLHFEQVVERSHREWWMATSHSPPADAIALLSW